MHLLRKVSGSNSDTFERYNIRKLRGTFPIVILAEQAEASNIPPVWQGLQIKRKSRAYLVNYPISALYLADQTHRTLEHHPRYGNSTPYMADW